MDHKSRSQRALAARWGAPRSASRQVRISSDLVERLLKIPDIYRRRLLETYIERALRDWDLANP